MKHIGWIIALLIGCLSGTQAKTNGFFFTHSNRSVRVEVKVRHNVVLIPVRINGSFEMNFILDTGVRTTILTEPLLANFLNLDSLRTIKVRGLGEREPMDAHLASSVSMTLPGGIEGRNLNLLILPEGMVSYSEMFGKPVHGIIGHDLFERFAIEINYQREFVRFWDPFRLPNMKRWESLPIVLRRGKPYVEATLIDSEGTEITENWLMDTGASMAISLFEDDLNLPQPHIDAFLGQGLSGNVYGKLGRCDALRLGSFEMEGVIAGYPEPEALGLSQTGEVWYGNIGAQVISRFRVLFDYPHRRVYIRKTSELNREFDYNVSGLEFLSQGTDYDTYIISYVRPDSPAEDAGLRVNDEILGLNGLPVLGRPIDELYGSLSRREGRAISLKIRRGDEVLRKRFVLISEI